MNQGGTSVTGDFLSFVLDEECEYFVKFKDTLAARFPEYMYRSKGFLPTSSGKETYTWRKAQIDPNNLESFLALHGIEVTAKVSN